MAVKTYDWTGNFGSGVKEKYEEDDILSFDVRFTSEYFETVDLPNSANIKNLLQIAITNENTVGILDLRGGISPHALYGGRTIMLSKSLSLQTIKDKYDENVDS